MGRHRAEIDKGSIYTEVLITLCFLLILILPVFAYTVEKYLTLNSLQLVGDAIDASCMNAYEALDIAAASRDQLSIDINSMYPFIKAGICENLKLDSEMRPYSGSIAAGEVTIESIELYMNGFPRTCPDGRNVRMPSIHIRLKIPLKPGLFRTYIINEHGPVYFRVHKDYEIPVI